MYRSSVGGQSTPFGGVPLVAPVRNKSGGFLELQFRYLDLCSSNLPLTASVTKVY